MSLPVWPTLLPQSPLRRGDSHSLLPNTLPVDPEVGEAMTRRRFTATQEDLQTALVLTPEQTVILREFFRFTLKSGALRFLWEDPVSGEAAAAIFLAPPSYSALGRNWSAAIKVRLFLP